MVSYLGFCHSGGKDQVSGCVVQRPLKNEIIVSLGGMKYSRKLGSIFNCPPETAFPLPNQPGSAEDSDESQRDMNFDRGLIDAVESLSRNIACARFL